MSDGVDPPDPTAIHTLPELNTALDKLCQRAARPGQVRLSVRDLSTRTGVPRATLHQYLSGKRFWPADSYEAVLGVLGVPVEQRRPWLDAWERIADARDDARRAATRRHPPDTSGEAAPAVRQAPQPITTTEEITYRMVPRPRGRVIRIGIVTGDIRRVRCAQVWVNSENTEMRMSRFEEYSVSAIIRFGGAHRDQTGRVVEDRIADELQRRLGGRRPVAPATAISTTGGALAQSNGVRYVIHVAAVRGEPGQGYRQIADVGQCVSNALAEADRLSEQDGPIRSILFPLLGTGAGGGEVTPTVRALLEAVIDYLAAARRTHIRRVYFLAYKDVELQACRSVFDARPELTRDDGPTRGT